MTSQELIALRFANQQLIRPGFKHPGELVAYLGVVQAQDYNGAKWALGVRLPGSKDRDIEEALERREIVRTWAFRGTLFFISPADVHWMVALVGRRVIDSIQGRYRRLELDEKTLGRCSELIVKALRDRRELTRRDLLAMLEKNRISTKGLRAAHILQRASLEGLVCQTAALRNNPTYILMDSVTSQRNPMGSEEALQVLAKRYFTSHGPATLKDFAWWLGLPVAEVKIGMEDIQAQLIRESIEGKEYWFAKSEARVNDDVREVLFLPAADEYLLGYKDRSPILDAEHAKMLAQGNGLNPFIVKGGRVAGTWRRTIGKNEVRVKINRFTEFSQMEIESMRRAKERFGEFLGLPIVET